MNLEPWSSEWKIAEVEKIMEKWGCCSKCLDLYEGRNNVVFGNGNVDADIMIVGIAPGAEEDIQGSAFVGPSGDSLNSMLTSLGVSREEVFVDNVIACHPPDNREPTKEEREFCLPRLYELIYIIDPMIIVCAGSVPLQALLRSRDASIDKMLGKISKVKVPGKRIDVEYDATAIYHPSFILQHEVVGKDGFYPRGGPASRSYASLEKAVNTTRAVRHEYTAFAERMGEE